MVFASGLLGSSGGFSKESITGSWGLSLSLFEVDTSPLVVGFCRLAIAAFMSCGHIVLLIYGGTWTSKDKHISMIC